MSSFQFPVTSDPASSATPAVFASSQPVQAHVEIIPVAVWGVDPLFSTYRKLLIGCIRTNIVVKESDGLLHFYLCRRPVVKVHIVGTVVSIERRAKRITFYVDDGTGVIRCIKFLDNDGYFPQSVDIGNIVDVKGNLECSETNSEPYGFAVRISMIEVQADPNVEVVHSLQAMELYHSVYKQKFDFPMI